MSKWGHMRRTACGLVIGNIVGGGVTAPGFHVHAQSDATDPVKTLVDRPISRPTDSTLFQDLVPAISLRDHERGTQIGSGWDPQWHQPTDVYTTYSDKDFRLGWNAAQTTLAALAQLAGATIKQ
jgi:hypothetical protein